jgi:predicted phosphodiesterase
MILGELSGPVLVFGGPYSNLPATVAMRDTARGLGIPAQRVICTGDTVAYGAAPNETVALLRDWGCHVVMGNCEESLAAQSPDCGCGFEDGSACSTLSNEWYTFANARLSPDHRAWMAGLPHHIRFGLEGRRCRVVHGSVDRINAFVFASHPVEFKQRQLAAGDADIVIGGHCGLPFGQRLPVGYWLNAGVIGTPANDGTPDGWFLLLRPAATGIDARWHRLPYDWAAARDAMQAQNLSPAYASSLETGLWPSLDVLPDKERAETGRALNPAPLLLA